MTTEAEVAPVVDAVAAAEGDVKPTTVNADKAPTVLKDVPKPDKPRMPKPDRTQLEGTIAVLQEAADENQARIEELKRVIEAKRDSRKNINAGSQETRARISELNAAFTAHMVSPPLLRSDLVFVDAREEREKKKKKLSPPTRVSDPRFAVFIQTLRSAFRREKKKHHDKRRERAKQHEHARDTSLCVLPQRGVDVVGLLSPPSGFSSLDRRSGRMTYPPSSSMPRPHPAKGVFYSFSLFHGIDG